MTDINAITAALIEGQRAVEDLPKVTAQLGEVQDAYRHEQEASANLREQLRLANETIAALQSNVRSLEVARDDAGFRELEASEKLERFRAAVYGSMGILETGLKESDTVMPQPEPEPQGRSEADPTASSTHGEVQDTPATPSVPEPASAPYDPTPPQPYANHSYHNKPADITWATFISGGGERPRWYNEERDRDVA